MLEKIKFGHVFKFLKNLIYSVLLGLSLFLTWEVILNYYLSKDSSYKQNQVPISTNPTITVCFLPRNYGELVYGIDFNISKYNNYEEYQSDKLDGKKLHFKRAKIQSKMLSFLLLPQLGMVNAISLNQWVTKL